MAGFIVPTYKTLLHKNNTISKADVDNNYVIHENKGGGDCLFHSISQLVDIKQEDLRKRVCDFYKNFNDNPGFNKTYAADKTEAIKLHLLHDPDKNNKKHHEEICNPGSWGSFTDCHIISVVLNIPIIFFHLTPSSDPPTYAIEEILGDRKNVSDEELVHLWYNGVNHFQSMKLKNIADNQKIKPLSENPHYNFLFASDKTEYERLLKDDPNGFTADIFYYKKKFGEGKVDSLINFEQNNEKMNLIILDVHDIKFHIRYLYGKEYVIVHELGKNIKTKIHSKFPPDDKVAEFIENAAKESETEKIKKQKDKQAIEKLAAIADNDAEKEEDKRKPKTTKRTKTMRKIVTEVEVKRKTEVEAKREETEVATKRKTDVEENKAAAKKKDEGTGAVVVPVIATSTEAAKQITKNADGCEVYTFTANGKGGSKNRKTKRKRRKSSRINSKTRHLHSTSRKAS